MKIKISIILIILVVCILNIGSDFKEYMNLKSENVSIIKKEDLPVEFSEKSYNNY